MDRFQLDPKIPQPHQRRRISTEDTRQGEGQRQDLDIDQG
jgi:hypothetical protein